MTLDTVHFEARCERITPSTVQRKNLRSVLTGEIPSSSFPSSALPYGDHIPLLLSVSVLYFLFATTSRCLTLSEERCLFLFLLKRWA